MVSFDNYKEKLLRCNKSGLVAVIEYMIRDFTELPSWDEETKMEFFEFLIKNANK